MLTELSYHPQPLLIFPLGMLEPLDCPVISGLLTSMIPYYQRWRPESEAFDNDYPLTAGWNPRIFIQALTWRILDVHL